MVIKDDRLIYESYVNRLKEESLPDLKAVHANQPKDYFFTGYDDEDATPKSAQDAADIMAKALKLRSTEEAEQMPETFALDSEFTLYYVDMAGKEWDVEFTPLTQDEPYTTASLVDFANPSSKPAIGPAWKEFATLVNNIDYTEKVDDAVAEYQHRVDMRATRASLRNPYNR